MKNLSIRVKLIVVFGMSMILTIINVMVGNSISKQILEVDDKESFVRNASIFSWGWHSYPFWLRFWLHIV